jgi:hypothetical protein
MQNHTYIIIYVIQRNIHLHTSTYHAGVGKTKRDVLESYLLGQVHFLIGTDEILQQQA